MNLSAGYTTNKDFFEELMCDMRKEKKEWGISHLYLELGLYAEQVEKYLDVFSSEKVRVYIFEEFKSNPYKILKGIFEFLEVESSYIPNLKCHYNVSNIPRNIIARFLLKIKRKYFSELVKFMPDQIRGIVKHILYTNKRPILDENAKKFLKNYYYDDIQKLTKLLGKDLSFWLE